MSEKKSERQGGDLAVLVALEMPDSNDGAVEEFQDLVSSAKVDIATLVTGKRQSPDYRYFVGSGKAEEIKELVVEFEANVIIFNHDLSPSQNRNLEQLCQCRVVDRTGLILDIFAQRAQSFEGKLQVELAQLTRLSTRLVRMHANLEQQRGGSVGLRGPGETQLEMDRRLIGSRIKQLTKRLDNVEQMRKQGRQSRQRNNVPTISLIGYTNAGKSSLFNRMTDADVYVQDQLFATLDPIHRSMHLDNIGRSIVVDTVGFISKLPHELVKAFRSTLQNAAESDLLLEVIDAVDPERDLKIAEVDKVLDSIGAGEVPRIRVFNKIDLNPSLSPHVLKNEKNDISVWISTKDHLGLDLLYQAISEFFQKDHLAGTLYLPSIEGALRAELFELDAVREEVFTEKGESILSIYIAKRDLMKIFDRYQKARAYFKEYI